MSLNLQNDCTFRGPALPVPFVSLNLETELNRRHLLPHATGVDLRILDEFWSTYRAHLRQLVSQGGSIRVKNQVIDPLLSCELLGYTTLQTADEVETREGRENGGAFLIAPDGARLRFWTAALNEDLDAPTRRGEAYRFSHCRIASRVLLASGERLGLLSNGVELRLLICDPARLDSHISIALDSSWKKVREVPDSFRLFIALAKPSGVCALPELVEKARLQQAKVTKDLRSQARLAVEEFIQAIIDHEENQAYLTSFTDPKDLSRRLWREGLITVYRLLFILKLESTDDPAKCFSFASGSLWRNSFSPGVTLAPLARAVLDRGEQTGSMLESGLRSLFRMLESGLRCTELNIKPMGGSLFAPHVTPILSTLRWTEQGVARLLDRLLWTTPQRGVTSRERVHYGPLDVEDLGRVYEALLELDPGIASEQMCRLRRAKLEVVVPAAQGERYRLASSVEQPADVEDESEDEAEEEETGGRGNRTRVVWIEQIPLGRFYLRVGLGRKSTGSFYTPHSFVRFLVQETIGELVQRVSPREDPQPAAILKLKMVDKAMGSGHFLVETARFMGDALYEACRRCDDLALAARQRAEALQAAGSTAAAEEEEKRATEYFRRVESLPDPDDELLRYLPSRAVEGVESGFSQQKAVVLCRRMIAVHCLYGVDKNPLAVELAKLALWIECHAEGLPLTFLDHRLVVGDSITGPFFEHLLKYPGTKQSLDDLFTQGLTENLTVALIMALKNIQDLELTVGTSVADIEAKQSAKARLDRALAPFRLLAAAWSGGVMLGTEGCDDNDYASLVRIVAETGDLPNSLGENDVHLRAMIAAGLGRPEIPPCANRDEVLYQLNVPDCVPAFSFDLSFPEVFYPTGETNKRHGFDADLGNPPWDRIEVPEDEFWANYDLEVLSVNDTHAREPIITKLAETLPEASAEWYHLLKGLNGIFRIHEVLYAWQTAIINGRSTTGRPDLYRLFAERSSHILAPRGYVGCIFPSAIHSNEGATGIRKLILENMRLLFCYSFENRLKLFEIDSRFKFAAVVFQRDSAAAQFDCGFYLQNDEWLFAKDRRPPSLCYTVDYIRRVGGPLLTFPECRTQVDADLLGVLYSPLVQPLGSLLEEMKINIGFGVELHRNRDFNCPRQLPEFLDVLCAVLCREAPSRIPVFEGKAFNQFTDRGEYRVDVEAPLDVVLAKTKWNPAIAYYRLAYRAIASSTNERTQICTIISPGIICNHSTGIESNPNVRPDFIALSTCAALNSYFADWQVRQRASSNISAFIFRGTRLPVALTSNKFLAHSSLRLICNHEGYKSLWHEQLGNVWREAGVAFTWPVLLGEDARWSVRTAIDAVVAQAYDLTREQYVHVLSSFSHSSYLDAPNLCLAAFDELQHDGLESFIRRNDPYWDIPLNESLPHPMMELPIQAAPMVGEEGVVYTNGDLFPEHTSPVQARGRRRRSRT